jgi:hypothetical protein
MSSSIPLLRSGIITLRIHKITFSRKILGAVLPALAGALVLAGCGGSSSNAASASGSATTAGLSAFQSCLRQHGVTVAAGPSGRPADGAFPTGTRPAGAFPTGSFPSGTPRPGASFASGNSAAFQACAKYAPSGAAGAPNQAVSSSSLAAFESCMSSHGVKVTGSTASAVLSQFRNSTGKAATAFHTCQALIQPAAPTPTPSS